MLSAVHTVPLGHSHAAHASASRTVVPCHRPPCTVASAFVARERATRHHRRSAGDGSPWWNHTESQGAVDSRAGCLGCRSSGVCTAPVLVKRVSPPLAAAGVLCAADAGRGGTDCVRASYGLLLLFLTRRAEHLAQARRASLPVLWGKATAASARGSRVSSPAGGTWPRVTVLR